MRRHVGRKRGVKYLDSFIEGAFFGVLDKRKRERSEWYEIFNLPAQEKKCNVSI